MLTISCIYYKCFTGRACPKVGHFDIKFFILGCRFIHAKDSIPWSFSNKLANSKASLTKTRVTIPSPFLRALTAKITSTYRAYDFFFSQPPFQYSFAATWAFGCVIHDKIFTKFFTDLVPFRLSIACEELMIFFWDLSIANASVRQKKRAVNFLLFQWVQLVI